VLFFDGGKIVEDAPPETIFTAPHEARTKEFLERVLNL
jgi:polar amino acid transport system ATP-binding protein